jgi:hypothetical protein
MVADTTATTTSYVFACLPACLLRPAAGGSHAVAMHGHCHLDIWATL